jgi:hypothetical protein
MPMSTGQSAPRDPAGPSVPDVHGFLQLLAGWVPDQELAGARRALADGQAGAAAAAAAAMAAEYDVPLLARDIDAGRALAAEPGVLDGAQPVPHYPQLPFWFSAFSPDERLEFDDVDQVMIEAAEAASPQVAGLWRSWRFPPDGFDEPELFTGDEDEYQAELAAMGLLPDDADEPEPADGDPADDDRSDDPDQEPDDPGQEEELRPTAAIDPADPERVLRVYIAQVTDGAVAPAVAGALHAALGDVGEAGIEVIDLDAEPPPYQAAALAQSALVWAAGADSEPPFRLARIFDFADPVTGPGFAMGHRIITDQEERDRMIQFLTTGTVILHTTARMKDVLDPDGGEVVPTSFRTDGDWIWTDTATYYLEYYGLAPDAELITHIDAQWQAGRLTSETDHETAVQAANFVLYPPSQHAGKAAWVSGPPG